MTKFVGNSITFPKLSSAPSSPVSGDAYYDTTLNKLFSYNGTSWVDLAAGGSGNTIYYQASQPASANAGDIWVDSDDNTLGDVLLTDSTSSTSTTTAATANSVFSVIKNINVTDYGATDRLANYPSYMIGNATDTVNQRVYYTKMVPNRNFTVTNITFATDNTVAATVTRVRFGIYTRSGTTFTLVARTAADATIFTSAYTKYTRALNTTGGYPATYDMTAGSEYWIAVLIVATSQPNIVSVNAATQGATTMIGAEGYTTSSQTDLPTSATGTAGLIRFYAEVS